MKTRRSLCRWSFSPAILFTLLACSMHVHAATPGKVIAWGDRSNYWVTNVPPDWTNAIAIAVDPNPYVAFVLNADGTVSGFPGLTNLIALAVGANTGVIGLRADGTVAVSGGAWQVPQDLTNVVAVAAGTGHALVLRADGTVTTWGRMMYGGGCWCPAFVPPDLNNVVAIAAGGYNSLALKADGTVVGWGTQLRQSPGAQFPQLEDMTVPPDLINVAAIATSDDHSLAIKSDSSVVQWGLQSLVVGLTNAAAVSAGDNLLSYALLGNGQVAAWGPDIWGEVRIASGLSNVLAIAAGHEFGVAILSHWPATILDQPLSQSIFTGRQSTLSVVAASNDPMTYQWRHYGYNLPGETNSTFTLSSARTSDAGNYTVIVSGQGGSVTSAPAILMVTESLPLVSLQPYSPTGRAVGDRVVLQFAVDGSGPLSYQWCFQGVAIADATDAALVVPSVAYSNMGAYTLVVTNYLGSVTSSPAQLFLPEYAFNGPATPRIWDFSAAYPELSATLQQDTSGFLTGTDWTGFVSGSVNSDGVSVGFSYSSSGSAYSPRDGKDVPAQWSHDLVFQPVTRILSGQSTVAYQSDYTWFYSGWIYVGPHTEYSFGSDYLHAPDSIQGDWKLGLQVQSDGRRLSGQASITLSHNKSVPLQIAGTNFPDGHSVLLLQGAGYNALTLRTHGPERSLWSLKGRVARQMIYFAITNPLALTVTGAGAVSPVVNGQKLELGEDYSMTATARPGNFFSHWIIGDFVTNSPVLNFTMSSNLAIKATFVTNIFPTAKGTYNGLFYESTVLNQRSSGFFTLTLSTNGAFSGKVLLDGGSYPFSGKFDGGSRTAQPQIRRGRGGSLMLQVELDPETFELRGVITDGAWTADLLGERAFSSALNPASNHVGVYTMAIPGNHGVDGDFIGDGYASISIDFNGLLHASGELADGTRFTHSARVSQTGQWPLYVPLYRGKGSIISWITFSNISPTSVGGEFAWFKPALPASKFFPAGLTNQTFAIGASLIPPIPLRGFRQLNFTNAIVILEGGNLQGSLTNLLAGSSSPEGPNRLILKWDNVSGLVRGSFIHPVTGKTTLLHGVVLGNQTAARGYFLGANQSGSFNVRPSSLHP